MEGVAAVGLFVAERSGEKRHECCMTKRHTRLTTFLRMCRVQNRENFAQPERGKCIKEWCLES